MLFVARTWPIVIPLSLYAGFSIFFFFFTNMLIIPLNLFFGSILPSHEPQGIFIAFSWFFPVI